MTSAHENAMSDLQANNATQQYPVSKYCPDCGSLVPQEKHEIWCICTPHIDRAESAEARAAELEARIVGLDRGLAKSDEIIAQLEAQLAGAAQTIVTLTRERDAARLELQHIRTMLDDGTGDEDDTAFDMARRLHAHDYALQSEAWYSRM